MSITKEELDNYIQNYQQGNPLITDEEYDILLEEYIKEHGESSRPFMRNKQSDSVNAILGTIPKVYGVETPMREGQPTYVDWIHKKKFIGDVFFQFKYDGCSVAYDCKTKRFFTRGDYDNGESVDVTDLFKHHNPEEFIQGRRHANVKLVVDLLDAIKFEAIMPNEIYNAYFKNEYKTPRDAVAAIITSHNVERAAFIHLRPLRYYRDGSQYVCVGSDLGRIVAYNEFEYMQTYIDALLKQNASMHDYDDRYSYACDGVVLTAFDKEEKPYPYGRSIEDLEPDEILRASDLVEVDPEIEIAIKILNLRKQTKLLNIEYQHGTTGIITPVAILEPIEFEGRTVTHVTLSNMDRVEQLDLHYGDTVNIMYNIVPYLVSSEHDGGERITTPDTCLLCGEKLNKTSLRIVRCNNPNCPSVIIGDIIKYVEKMKMFGISANTIYTLYNNGLIKTIPDLYRLTPDMISKLPGFGEKSADNIVNSIKESSTNVSLIRWFGAIPINNISTRIWESIINVLCDYDLSKAQTIIMDLLSNDTPTKFIESIGYISGISVGRYKMIVDGLNKNWSIMKDCVKYITFEEIASNNSKGKVCLSGTRDKALIETLKSEGYEATDTFTTDCKAVIVPTKIFTSAKTIKAKKHNIPVYTISDILNGGLMF